MSLTITDIQRFCVHDGPGIRTTVFLKGCTLRCPWCANPETIKPQIEYKVDKNKCIGKNNRCEINGLCSVIQDKTITENDYRCCSRGSIVQIGNNISTNKLLGVIEKDVLYYDPYGGVTFSGGEPLLQLRNNIEILKTINEKYNVCIETALCVELNNLEELQQHINHFFVDIKSFIKEDYKQLTGGNLDTVLSNLEKLNRCNRSRDIVIRMPFIPDYTNKQKNIDNINELINKYNFQGIQILKLHNLAKKKYELLDKQFVENPDVNIEKLLQLKDNINHGNITILKI